MSADNVYQGPCLSARCHQHSSISRGQVVCRSEVCWKSGSKTTFRETEGPRRHDFLDILFYFSTVFITVSVCSDVRNQILLKVFQVGLANRKIDNQNLGPVVGPCFLTNISVSQPGVLNFLLIQSNLSFLCSFVIPSGQTVTQINSRSLDIFPLLH